jgi:putative hydrolase of the HAD superfamily
MLRAILFDMGGTLDGDGQHWLDRFVRLYASHGLDLPREAIRKGFDAAERRSWTDEAIRRANVDRLVRSHLAWQFETHGLRHAGLLDRMATDFARPIHAAGGRNVALLTELRDRGYTLGVVSNACGNARALCDDLGYGPLLSFVVDSRVVGIAKPDPAIYRLALDRLRLPAGAVLMVGDSYERDIVPAHSLGMRTAWLVPDNEGDRGVADVRLTHLADLLAHVTEQERTPA